MKPQNVVRIAKIFVARGIIISAAIVLVGAFVHIYFADADVRATTLIFIATMAAIGILNWAADNV